MELKSFAKYRLLLGTLPGASVDKVNVAGSADAIPVNRTTDIAKESQLRIKLVYVSLKTDSMILEGPKLGPPELHVIFLPS